MKTFFSIVTILHCALAWGQDKPLNSYDVVWNAPSKNSSESMPCGGGDIGLNVWVENGELLIYVSRSGTFDENNALLKAGRLRISMQPNLLEGATFEQKLNLNDGHITIKGTKGSQKVNIDIWVDVFRPVSHIAINSSVAVTTSVSFENWRHQDRAISGRENNSNAYKWTSHLDIRTS